MLIRYELYLHTFLSDFISCIPQAYSQILVNSTRKTISSNFQPYTSIFIIKLIIRKAKVNSTVYLADPSTYVVEIQRGRFPPMYILLSPILLYY
jgi:hypothetical protein